MVAKWVRSSAFRGRNCWRKRRCVGNKFFLGCGIKPFGEKVDSGMYNSTIRRQHVLKEFMVFFTVYMYTLKSFQDMVSLHSLGFPGTGSACPGTCALYMVHTLLLRENAEICKDSQGVSAPQGYAAPRHPRGFFPGGHRLALSALSL